MVVNLNGLVRLAFNKKVRFEQRLEVSEGVDVQDAEEECSRQRKQPSKGHKVRVCSKNSKGSGPVMGKDSRREGERG